MMRGDVVDTFMQQGDNSSDGLGMGRQREARPGPPFNVELGDFNVFVDMSVLGFKSSGLQDFCFVLKVLCIGYLPFSVWIGRPL